MGPLHCHRVLSLKRGIKRRSYSPGVVKDPTTSVSESGGDTHEGSAWVSSIAAKIQLFGTSVSLLHKTACV